MMQTLHKSYFFIATLLSSVSLLYAKEVTIKTHADFQNLLDNKETGVVKFSMTGCSHCTECKDDFDKAAKDPELREFVFCSAHDASEASHRQGITGYPSFVYIADGKVVETEKGAEDDLKNHLKRKLKNLRSQSTQSHIDAENNAVENAALPASIDAAQAEAEAEGFLAKIYGFVVMLLTKVKDLIVSILDWIKGLFGK